MADSNPTPNPAMNRPAARTPTEELAVWIMTPTIKMKQPMRMVNFRPMKSAQSPAIMAPKNVPEHKISILIYIDIDIQN